jgi:cellulose synthase/poly-beta-1,6-N-acetylglucosamine synthase-like glycosyltransferase
VTILIPSYREERRVLLATVLSAAMAEHANRRIVVLVDDPPSDAASLACTMTAIRDARRWMADQAGRLGAEAAAWQARSAFAPFAPRDEARRLAASYQSVAAWLHDLADRIEGESEPEFRHVDGFVADRVVRDLAARCRRRAYAIAGRTPSRAEADAEYRRLARLFCADISTFQRKSFENLSHAPNKAMNLNAYIGLMGGRWVAVEEDGRRRLEPTNGRLCDLDVERPDYVLTLDADSVILNDYVATLARILEENPRAAVAQTPYLTFPHGPSPVERIAGATTDIQYLVHQGSSWFDAAYWVGANALIRFAALEQIATTQVEDGKAVKVFIQDRTVIEDTGSTIDLLRKGWRVHNHFEPLAYSATPADFGAL